MKKNCLFLLVAIFLFSHAFSQQKGICATELMFHENAQKNPLLIEQRNKAEQQIAKFYEEHKTDESYKTTAGTRIIPVVFHVIHDGGPENISKAQILDQIRILNEDFRKQNADIDSAPAPFKKVAADCNIEFRLASKDPYGQCTDGIVRIYSSLTNGPDDRDAVKTLSYWNSSMYLNVWVVKKIDSKNTQGTILGYAQLPGNNSKTDGCVLRADYVGSIEYAEKPLTNLPNGRGRTGTHEVGHWLGLRHVWGDATCGDDFVGDTPTQETDNNGCPDFPHITCANSPDGDMFNNYMDYTNGSCQNMFTTGQKNRIDIHFTMYRSKIISDANLTATGVKTISTSLCPPIADFTSDRKMICMGDSLKFSDVSQNGTPTSWNWTFKGGTPSASTSRNQIVTYNAPGKYDVILTAGNASGNSSKIRTEYVYVSDTASSVSTPYKESFEDASYPNSNWIIVNDYQNTWQKSTTAFSGKFSLYINNYSDNTEFLQDILISPPLDFTTITSDKMTFKLAYAQRDNTSNDRLTIYASTDCGATWALKYNKSGAALATTSIQKGNFVPGASQWRTETIVNTAAFVDKKNVRFKFEFTCGNGNNIYIDDIEITGVVGMEETNVETLLNFNVYPHPVVKNSVVVLTLQKPENVQIELYDVLGRAAVLTESRKMDTGQHEIPLNITAERGVYCLKLTAGDKIITRKILLGTENQ